MCMRARACRYMYAVPHTWRAENNLEGVGCFHHMGLRDKLQMVRLDSGTEESHSDRGLSVFLSF